MPFLKIFRKIFYRLTLKNRLKEQRIKHAAISMNEAKSFGILFNAENEIARGIVKKYSDYLKEIGKTVELLGYSNRKKNIDLPYFTSKKFIILGSSNNKIAETFIKKEYDILINAYTEENLPLEYISTYSKAKFRIGIYKPEKTFYCDFMINLDQNNPSLDLLLKEIDHYLNMIKTNA